MRAAAGGDRLVGAAGEAAHLAEIGVVERNVRRDRDGAAHMLDRLVELAGLMRDDAEHVRGLGVVRLCRGGAAGEFVGVGRESRGGASARRRTSAWPGDIACAGSIDAAPTARAASSAMIAAACAARRSPSALNGISCAASPCTTRLELRWRRARSPRPNLRPAAGGTCAWSGTRAVFAHEHASANRVTQGISTQTGLPSAPARCATDVSTVITRSSALRSRAAVSAKSASSGDRSSTAILSGA